LAVWHPHDRHCDGNPDRMDSNQTTFTYTIGRWQADYGKSTLYCGLDCSHSAVYMEKDGAGGPSHDGPLASSLAEASGAPAPDMKGGQVVPEWQKMVNDKAVATCIPDGQCCDGDHYDCVADCCSKKYHDAAHGAPGCDGSPVCGDDHHTSRRRHKRVEGTDANVDDAAANNITEVIV